jgi:D-amino-acid dehydrogenase
VNKQILIIGGGVIGLSAAYYCAQRGHRVTVIERNSEQLGNCSSGNAGMIVPSHFVPLAAPGMVALGLKWMWNPESPFYIKPRLNPELFAWGMRFWRAATPAHVRRSAPLLRDLSFASRACFEELAALPDGDFGLVKRGLVMICKTQHTLDDEARFAARANELGVPAQVLDAKGLAQLDPDVTMDAAGGVYFPRDCHLLPERFLARLKQHATRAGVTFEWNTRVTEFARQGSCLTTVRTNKADFRADEIVLAGGAWSPLLGRELGLSIPIQAGKGYSLTLDKPRQLPQICAIFTEARMAITPLAGKLRFGGTMELAGLKETINPRRIQGIIKNVPKYYPAFSPSDFAGIQPWCGLRPCSPDGLPYLGRTRKYANLTVACGHAMMGLSLGPITGRLVAEILSGEKPSFDLQLLNPDRYHPG